MSYCVNCGVELEEAADKCPLCDTPVINPRIHKEDDVSSSYSDRLEEIPESMKRRYTAFIITIVMLIPNIVCFLVNILFKYDHSWVWFLNATSILIWTFIVLPLIRTKRAAALQTIIDALVSFGYAYVLFRLERARGIIPSHGKGWLIECAVPVIVIVAVMIGFLIEWVRRKSPHWAIICIAISIEIILTSVSIDVTLVHYIKGSFMPSVSLIISACCLALIAFFSAVACNKRLQTWLDKKFFVD